MSRGGTNTKRRPPFAWASVLHYANAFVTAENWVAVLLRTRGAAPHGQTYGFHSADEVRPILDEFRDLLGNLLTYSPKEAECSMILEIINERAEGTFYGWTWNLGTGRVFPQIRTKDESFKQYLYAQLATAMTVEAYTSIKRCRVCQRFFYEPRRSTTELCSARCRTADAKSRAARYRADHQEEYREYQRRLMAKRRREGTA